MNRVAGKYRIVFVERTPKGAYTSYQKITAKTLRGARAALTKVYKKLDKSSPTLVILEQFTGAGGWLPISNKGSC